MIREVFALGFCDWVWRKVIDIGFGTKVAEVLKAQSRRDQF
jgi:hypothetical protein